MSQTPTTDIPNIDETFGLLNKEVIASRIEQNNILQQSAANGGPGTANDSIVNLMDYLNVGVRELSRGTGIKRSQLAKMIQGSIPMPPEIFSKIRAVFVAKNPGLFENDPVSPQKAKKI